MRSHVIVAGAGIVGLSAAYELGLRGYCVTVLEKEAAVAEHQTGNNSGVIHSGLYYTPGSLRAVMGRAGSLSMRDFAREHGIAVNICGKLVVATSEAELPALHGLLGRGRANGVPCREITPEEAREYEPHVHAVSALRVETTGVIDYRGVCAALCRLIEQNNGQVILGQKIVGVTEADNGVIVTTPGGEYRGDQFVNCAGLYSDRVARLAGFTPNVRIIPFRGEYFELIPEEAQKVKGLIYPVPNPDFPFLGVHFTRMFDGSVHAGPNAIFALSREGYNWRRISLPDLVDSALWPGLWTLGRKFWRTGIDETLRSFSRRRFLTSLRALIPDLSDDALVPTHAGVRAQAMRRDGTLVDDFYFERGPRQIHVLNAPSPAATAALEIGKRIADEVAAGA
jgi:(S)-2-hydroxyglutarate dehydrogenase